MTTSSQWKNPPRTWAESTVERVAASVRRARGKRSAAWLSDQTATLGHPISRTVISDLENGRKRSLDVGELIVIAAALGVPPISLLYPEIPDGVVEALPNWPTTSWDALRWFTGEARLQRDLDLDDVDGLIEVSADGPNMFDAADVADRLNLPTDRDALAKLALLRERGRLMRVLSATMVAFSDADSETFDTEPAKAIRQALHNVDSRLHELDGPRVPDGA
ncbi:helix-turn-helix domain-containing protein [Gordonia spumicola]|uniref:helix-turn-helix domain-containing protein n=1 Tax=Gordonia spumicola TaxID=589161 RepID=UPI001379B633|nr:helix-turn-helix transcriptional regulator [Gordonia spumicola]